MTQALRTYSHSIVAKVAFTLLSTSASSLLVPIALRHTSNAYNFVLVLAVAAIWIASLTRMWVHVITLMRSGIPAPPMPMSVNFKNQAGHWAV